MIHRRLYFIKKKTLYYIIFIRVGTFGFYGFIIIILAMVEVVNILYLKNGDFVICRERKSINDK